MFNYRQKKIHNKLENKGPNHLPTSLKTDLSRHKQSFFIKQMPKWNISLKEVLCSGFGKLTLICMCYLTVQFLQGKVSLRHLLNEEILFMS